MKNQEKTLTGDQILADAITLAPTIVECRDEIERERRLPMHLVDAMKKAGVFRIARPGEWGGKHKTARN
jgi:indole-3-acetate monooxygenase